MWRRFGDEAFSLLVAVVVTTEAAVLMALVLLLGGRATGLVGPSRVRGVLLLSLVTVGVGLILLTVYLLVYQGISQRREHTVQETRSWWVGLWLDVLYRDRKPPVPPLPAAEVAALLEVRETLKGVEGRRVAEIVDRYALGVLFSRKVRSLKGSARWRPSRPLRRPGSHRRCRIWCR